jgi:hypothetical protein
MSEKQSQPFWYQIPVWWVFIYIGLGGLAMMNRETSFLAEPVDHMPMWFMLIFLNVPLQMGLGFASLICYKKQGKLNQIAKVLVSLALLLIAVNLATAIWIKFR